MLDRGAHAACASWPRPPSCSRHLRARGHLHPCPLHQPRMILILVLIFVEGEGWCPLGSDVLLGSVVRRGRRGDRLRERPHLVAVLVPRADSTPLATSTANGRTVAIASPTFSGVSPAAEDQRHPAGPCPRRRETPVPRRQLPGEDLAGAAGDTGPIAVNQVEVGVKPAQRLDVRATGDAHGLDHPAARAARRFCAERGPSSPCSCSIVRPTVSACARARPESG